MIWEPWLRREIATHSPSINLVFCFTYSQQKRNLWGIFSQRITLFLTRNIKATRDATTLTHFTHICLKSFSCFLYLCDVHALTVSSSKADTSTMYRRPISFVCEIMHAGHFGANNYERPPGELCAALLVQVKFVAWRKVIGWLAQVLRCGEEEMGVVTANWLLLPLIPMVGIICRERNVVTASA